MQRYAPLTTLVMAVAAVVLLTAPVAAKELARIAELRFSALDMQKIEAEDYKRASDGEPLRYAIPHKINRPIANGAAGINPDSGTWEDLGDGRTRWRLRVHATGATSLDFGFSRFFMPPGGELIVYNESKTMVRGPYTDADNEQHGQLWTPLVEGDTAIIEVTVPTRFVKYLELELNQVSHGYRMFWKAGAEKSGGCNIDVICPAGDPWVNQIQSVAGYGLGGSLFCTGQMINNTASDRTPYFLTADHCNINSGNAASLVVYWNFENSFCRMPLGPGASGPGDGMLSDTQTGAVFRADGVASDFTLVELDDDPNPAFDVFWTGWDRRENPSSGTGIHHPDGEEKRISFENDPPSITSYLGEPVPGDGTHWRVGAWDVGTTEPGSSGSGLWNQDMRIIGQLHGGFARCEPFTGPEDNDDSDWYGRFSVSWDAGGMASGRLREWLDPLAKDVNFIDGTGTCNAPSVNFTSSAVPGTAGDPVTFSSSVSGGAPPYSYAWDVDGNGSTDALTTDVTAVYPSAWTGNVRLTVTDSQDCAASRSKAQIIEGANFVVSNVGAAQEIDGNGDAFIDPGERWSAAVTLRNEGEAMATSPHAVFSRFGNTNAGKNTGGPDTFGYTYTDTSEGDCPYDFVNITNTGTAVLFNPTSPSFPANDDGASDPLPLAQPFDLYGTILNEIVMTSNGYLAVGNDTGGDWDNDCPLPATPDQGGTIGRINPLHDDLITGNARFQYFASCPRPSDFGADVGCHVFQWNDTGFWTPTGIPDGDFRFQTLLYDDTYEIVYQFPTGNQEQGANSTTGIQNTSASDGLTYACNNFGSIANNSSVCFAHPDAVNRLFNSEGVHLETPLLEYANAGPGIARTMDLVFSLESDYPCGDAFAFNLDGVISDTGFSEGELRVFEAVTGDDGVCAPAVNTVKGGPAPIEPVFGMMYNPDRDGHGIDVHTAGSVMFLVWYTYLINGTSVWYIASGDYVDNQFKADLLQFNWPGQATGQAENNKGGPTNQTVGSVTLTFNDPGHAALIWTLNGKTAGEPFQTLIVDTGATPMNRTGHWFPPSQSGWGMTVNMQGDTEFEVVYLYDIFGNGRWVVGPKFDPAEDTTPLDSFLGFCPTCARVGTMATPAGTVTRTFTSSTEATVSTNISLPAPLSGDWNRSDVPFVIISDPQ